MKSPKMPNRSNAGLRSLVSRLTSELDKLEVRPQQRRNGMPSGNPGRGRRRGRRGRSNNSGPGNSQIPGAKPMPTQRNPRIKSGNPGVLHVSHTEYWGVVDLNGTSADKVVEFNFMPMGSGLAHLDTLAKIYERYVVTAATVHYRPSVGTTKDGALTLGAEWDAAHAPNSLKAINVCQPNKQCAVWQACDMRLPRERLMQQKFLKCTGVKSYDSTAFTVVAGSQAQALMPGTIWLTYTVRFEGPRLAT